MLMPSVLGHGYYYMFFLRKPKYWCLIPLVGWCLQDNKVDGHVAKISSEKLRKSLSCLVLQVLFSLFSSWTPMVLTIILSGMPMGISVNANDGILYWCVLVVLEGLPDFQML